MATEVLTFQVSDSWVNHREIARTLYAKLEQHSRLALEKILLLGNLFNSVKAGIERGEFMPFVESTGVPYSTANLYMNMAAAARFNPALLEGGSIRGMLRPMHEQRENIAEAVDRKLEDAPVTPIHSDPTEPEPRPHENFLTADQIATIDRGSIIVGPRNSPLGPD